MFLEFLLPSAPNMYALVTRDSTLNMEGQVGLERHAQLGSAKAREQATEGVHVKLPVFSCERFVLLLRWSSRRVASFILEPVTE